MLYFNCKIHKHHFLHILAEKFKHLLTFKTESWSPKHYSWSTSQILTFNKEKKTQKTSALKISIVRWRTLHPRGAQNADSWKFLLPFARSSSLSRNTGLFSSSLYRDSAENTHTQVYLPSDISSKMFSLSRCSRGVINLRSDFKRLQTLRSWAEWINKHTLMSDVTFDPGGHTLFLDS